MDRQVSRSAGDRPWVWVPRAARVLITFCLTACSVTIGAVVAQWLASGDGVHRAASIGWTSAGCALLTGALAAALSLERGSRLRHAWEGYVPGAVCWIIGAAVIDAGGPGPLSLPVALCWLVFPVCAVLSFGRRLPRGFLVAVFLLDALPVVLLLVAIERTVVFPFPAHGLGLVLLILYPAVYCLPAAHAVQVVGYTGNPRRVPVSVWWFTAGYILLALATLTWVPAAVRGGAANALPFSPLWSAGLLAISYSGVKRALQPSTVRALPRVEREGGPHALIPAAAVLGLVVMTPAVSPSQRPLLQGFLITAVMLLSVRVYLMHREAVRLMAELVRLAGIKDEFVALVSHELRTPLTSIIGYLELLSDDVLTSTQRQFTDVMERNARRLLRVVGDLLFLAQLQTGELAMEFRETDLAEVAKRAVEEARPATDAKKIALTLCAGPVPPLRADHTRLSQLFDNLISNAIKFTPTAGQVTVGISASGGFAEITVSDTGIGIAPADQRRVFERFYRTATATGLAIQGTGLGLTISKAIVDAHEGSVTVDSQPGHGTTFRVRLPLRHQASAVPEPPPGSTTTGTHQENRHTHSQHGTERPG